MSTPEIRAPSSAVVIGFGVTGRAVASFLTTRGTPVVVGDDSPEALAAAREAGFATFEAGDLETLRAAIGGADMVVPSPGVPQHHAAYRIADELGVPVVSELDLATEWDDRPVAAITGTNGKTTVTMLVTRMLRRSGVEAVAVGNTDTPFVTAVDADEPRADAFVVEASSFRLERVRRFRPRVGCWLNLAPDHLDWHGDLDRYAAAKARIWAQQGPEDVAVVPTDDPVIADLAARADGRIVTFGGPGSGADVAVADGWLVAHGVGVIPVDELARTRPHDLSNAAAGAAVALAMGATREAVAAELRAFEGIPHRLQFVAERGGIRFHNDSKATAPHATLAAIEGFERAVLIAGGRNKDLDLGGLAVLAPRLAGVVALGEAAGEIAAVFCGSVPVETAGSMAEAIRRAADMAAADGRCGDVVLSPSCASYDMYDNYEARGDDFVSIVTSMEDE